MGNLLVGSIVEIVGRVVEGGLEFSLELVVRSISDRIIVENPLNGDTFYLDVDYYRLTLVSDDSLLSDDFSLNISNDDDDDPIILEEVTEFDDYLSSSAKLDAMLLQADKTFLASARIQANDVVKTSLIETHFGIVLEA